jgi:hypothetical protein
MSKRGRRRRHKYQNWTPEEAAQKLREAQAETRERLRGMNPEAMLEVHAGMYDNPDELIKAGHLKRGDKLLDEDDELVRYEATDWSAERQRKVVLSVDFEAGERIYESRVYRTIPFGDLTVGPHQMKILAKTRPDGRIWWATKFERPDGSTFLHTAASNDARGWVTEADYRAAVEAIVSQIGSISVMSEPTIITGAEYEARYGDS